MHALQLASAETDLVSVMVLYQRQDLKNLNHFFLSQINNEISSLKCECVCECVCE